MAPTESDVEWQTNEIIRYLLEPDDGVSFRQCAIGVVEPDCPTKSNDTFDPVLIADKLRSVADAFNDDVTFKAALNDLKKAAAQEAMEVAFGQAVEALCQTPASESAEVASEMQLIRASVAVGLYVIKSSPNLKNTVQCALTTFLNRRVCTWVKQQGGWEKVNISD